MSLIIRRFQKETDAEAVVRLAHLLAAHHGDVCRVSPDAVSTAITLGHLEVIVAEWAGCVVGYASVQRRMNLAAGTNALQLTELVVHPDHRRLGIGRALVRFVAQEAVARDVPAVNLGVGASNPEAHAFYRALGFAIAPSTGHRGELSGKALRHVGRDMHGSKI
jgi:ribosomal protein S18 acetylase RimI-like enzyme